MDLLSKYFNTNQNAESSRLKHIPCPIPTQKGCRKIITLIHKEVTCVDRPFYIEFQVEDNDPMDHSKDYA